MKETLFIYTRVSTDIQAEEGYSLATQKSAGIAKAIELGFNYQIFEEAGKSAASDNIENREQLKELMRLIEDGKAKYIYVVEESRLARNLIISATLMGLFIKHKCVVYVKDDFTDYGNLNSEKFLTKYFISGVSYNENLQRVERSKRGKLEAVKNGKWGGGMCAYGYRVDENGYLIVDEKEAKWYRKMVELSLAGKGCASIARILNEKSVKTKASQFYHKGMTITDKHTKQKRFIDKNRFIWRPNTVLTILKNTLYKGERKFNGKIYQVSPIIDSMTWQKVQDNMMKNRITSSRNNVKYFYLLKNLLVCNRCGKSLLGYIKPSRGMRVYYCSSKRQDPTSNFCGMKSVNIDKLNNLVWDTLIDVISNSAIARKQLKKQFSETKIDVKKVENEIKAINKKIEQTENERTNLFRIARKVGMSDEELKKQLAEVAHEKSELEKAILINQQKIELSKNQQNTYTWILRAEEAIKKLQYTTDEEKKKEVVNRFIAKIFVDYIDEADEHVIELKLKYRLFDGNNDTIEMLLNGTILTSDIDSDKTSVIFSKEEIAEMEYDDEMSEENRKELDDEMSEENRKELDDEMSEENRKELDGDTYNEGIKESNRISEKIKSLKKRLIVTGSKTPHLLEEVLFQDREKYLLRILECSSSMSCRNLRKMSLKF